MVDSIDYDERRRMADRPLDEPVAREPTRVRRLDHDHDHDEHRTVGVREDRRVITGPEGEAYVQEKPMPGFSLGATFLGWCVASFLTFVFLGLVGLAVTPQVLEAMNGSITVGEAQQAGIITAIGALLAIFIAYLIGGYAAGRISLWRGMLHGAIVPVWTILVAILSAVLAAVTTTNFTFVVPAGVDVGDLTAAGVLAGVITLAAMFGGAILGGLLGQRVDVREIDEYSTRRTTVRRGRPL